MSTLQRRCTIVLFVLAHQPNSSNKFGYWLHSLRKASGKTQREVATAAGIDFTYLSKLEHGKDPAPSEELIERLARVLDVPPEHLLAAAGKVPARVRQRIDQNPRFALLLKRLAESDEAALDRHYRLARVQPFGLASPTTHPQMVDVKLRRQASRRTR